MPLLTPARISAKVTARPHEQVSTLLNQIRNAEAHFARHLRGRLRNARITVHRDGVILQGRASSYYVKQLAQHAVMKHVSQPIAANEIEVALLPEGRKY